MARRIASVPYSSTFVALSQEALQANESNDCAVKAITVVTGRAYKEVLMTMTMLGRKPRSGTPMPTIFKALELFGKRAVAIDQRTITSRYPGKHSLKARVTTHQPDRFPAAWRDGKTYLMLVSGHILAVVNGVNHDWSRSASKDCITLFEVVDL